MPQPHAALADLARDTALAPFVRAGVAVMLWDEAGRRVLWASPEAAPLVARMSPEGITSDALAERLSAIVTARHGKRGIGFDKLGVTSSATVTCACQVVELPDGGRGLLTAVVGRLPALDDLGDAAATPPVSPDEPVEGADARPAASPADETPPMAEVEDAPQTAESTPETGPPVVPDTADATGPDASEEALVAIAALAAERPRRRFTFAVDRHGVLASVSADYAEALGVDAPVGQPLAELAGTTILGDAEALAAVSSHQTFALRGLTWRVAETDVVVPADLSAVALVGPDASFTGLRGFGVLHLDAAHRLAPAMVDEATAVAPDEVTAEEVAPDKAVVDEAVADEATPAATIGTDGPAALSGTPADPAEPPASAAEAPAVAEPPVLPDAHPLARVTARLREWTDMPRQVDVSADWATDDAPRRTRTRRETDAGDDMAAWATDAVARFGDSMSENARVVADLRARLRKGGEPAAEGRAILKDGLTESDRQTLRDIARALGDRALTPPPPPPAPTEPAADRTPEPRVPDLRLVAGKAAPPADATPAAGAGAAEASDRPEREALRLQLAARDAELRELSSILDTATDGVVVIDERSRILSMNRSAEALFGYDQKEVAGEPFTLLLASESHPLALDYLEGLRANGVASILNDGREVSGRVRQGGRIPLFMTLGRIAEGPERKFCAVLRDLTAWKRAETELLEAKRAAERANAQKSDFLATVSHEIRTPLNAIIGFAEMMLEERFGPVGNDRYTEYLRDIHASGGHVISLVNDLLDLAKIEAGRLELDFAGVDVNEIVRGCVSLLQGQANRSRVILRTSLGPNLPQVVADARSLRQIALNVLSNAIKFTDAGGQVIVSTALTDRGELALRVRDTGIGMSDADVKAAMEPFRQVATARRAGGTGLGLPLTKALVEANRGAFAITSAQGEGTLVEVVFPATRVLAD